MENIKNIFHWMTTNIWINIIMLLLFIFIVIYHFRSYLYEMFKKITTKNNIRVMIKSIICFVVFIFGIICINLFLESFKSNFNFLLFFSIKILLIYILALLIYRIGFKIKL